MRTLDLKRTFDIVLAHDAIGYMTTEADLQAAIGAASAHLRPGGLAIFLPDMVRNTFQPTTECGGRDLPDGRGLRYLEWTHDPDPSDTTVVVEFALMIRDSGKAVRLEHDTHLAGLFDLATWRRSLNDAGLQIVDIDIPDPYAGQRAVFVGRRSFANPEV